LLIGFEPQSQAGGIGFAADETGARVGQLFHFPECIEQGSTGQQERGGGGRAGVGFV
jgi:hypothetical protein